MQKDHKAEAIAFAAKVQQAELALVHTIATADGLDEKAAGAIFTAATEYAAYSRAAGYRDGADPRYT